MTLPPQSVQLVKEFEGCSLQAYKDMAGKLTIGYGHCGPEVKLGQTITQEEADNLLLTDMESAACSVKKYVKVPLNDNEFSALISFTFNVGPQNLKRSSLVVLLNAGRYEAVPVELLRWCKAGGAVVGGLYRRRVAEAELWNKKT